MQFEPDKRGGLGEEARALGQPILVEPLECRDPELRGGLDRTEVHERLVDLAETDGQLAGDVEGRSGPLYAGRMPVEKLDAQIVFQASDLLSDRGHGYAEFLACSREGPVPKGRFQSTYAIEIEEFRGSQYSTALDAP